jgi:hypothetical protein
LYSSLQLLVKVLLHDVIRVNTCVVDFPFFRLKFIYVYALKNTFKNKINGTNQFIKMNNVSFGKGDDEKQYMRFSQALIDNVKRKHNDGGLCGSASSVFDDNSEDDDNDSENGSGEAGYSLDPTLPVKWSPELENNTLKVVKLP